MEHVERFFRLSNVHGIDNYLQLYYGSQLEKRLQPCAEIKDRGMLVGIVGNGSVRPDQLLLTDRDREPILVTIPETGETCKVYMPGKSGIIILNPSKCGKDELKDIVNNHLGGQYDRHDHLHAATIGNINEAGWNVYWAPLQLERKILHTRLIAKRTVELGLDPSEEDVTALSSSLAKIC